MKKRLCAAGLALAMLCGVQASAWDGAGIGMSWWATDEIQAAYDSGAVSTDFDLGTDYTRPITRGELARLTVDLVAHEQQLTIDDLVTQFGIALQAVPLTPAQPADEMQDETAQPSETDKGATPPELDEGEPTDGETTSDTGEDEPADSETTSAPGESESADGEATSEPAEGEPADGEATSESTENDPADGEATSENGEAVSETTENKPADSEAVSENGESNPADGEATSEPEIPAWGDPLDGGLPFVASPSFGDSQSVYVEIAAKLGIINGSNGLFRPNDLVTRAEAAAMMQRCMGVLGFSEANRQPMQFSDNYDIPRWAVESVKYISGRTDAAGQAIMGGSGGKFSPKGTYTVEQAILSLRRMQSSLSMTDVAEGWRDAPGYNSVQLALTFGGDCTLGRGHNFAYSGSLDEMYNQKGAAYFFSGISEFFNDDLTMVNFEGTLTTSTAYANKTFVFKGPPEYARILEKGSIDVVTVANNHSMDYLQRGFDDTIRNLSPYVAVSGYERMPIVTVKGVRIGFASNVGWSYDAAQRTFITNAIKTLRARGADIIVFNYHWGVEKAYKSNSTQQAIAHYCIDQGADLVIGHHPHVKQEVEVYKGKPIAYSLGNLVFGGNNNPSDKNCLIFRQNYTFDLDTRTITASSYKAIPYKISSVSWRNDYHPVKA